MNEHRSLLRSAAVLAVLLSAIAFSGCSDVKEINDMAIVSGLSVDLTSAGTYRVSAEVVNKSTEGSPEESREMIAAEGNTLGDALENCNFQDSRQIYFSHAKTLILGRSLAENIGVEPVLDYVMRNYKTRLSMDLMISALPDAASVAELSTSSTGLVYYDLEEMVKTDQRYGACSPTKVYQAVNTLKQADTDLTIPIVSESEGKALLTGTAVFHGGKMIGSLTQEETLYLMMLQNHLDTAHLALPQYGMTFHIVSSDVDFHSVGIDTPELKAELQLTCTVSQAGSDMSYADSAVLSDELARSVELQCAALVKKAQEWNADIFGFSKSMGTAGYQFSALPVSIECSVKLKPGEVH